MPKKEYIERVALIKFAMKYIPNINGDTTMKAVKRALKAAPAADDVVEVVHGEWIKAGTGITERIVCSACNSSKGYYGRPPFCNQCGAKMGGERKDIP